MKRNRHAQDAGIEEKKTHHAHKSFALPGVHHGPLWHMRSQHGRIDLIVQHRQIAPNRRQKGSHFLHHSAFRQ